MAFRLEAACLCSTGLVRRNNEDNFFFDGICLPAENGGLERPASLARPLRGDRCLAVFDGMGGENFGEEASFAAADCLQRTRRGLRDCFLSPEEYLPRLCGLLNEAVMARAEELCTRRMGTTLAALWFTRDAAVSCNLGDSRVYRLRGGELLQLSVDHVERRAASGRRKAPLTQHLGVDPEEFLLEPSLRRVSLSAGDRFLICSDGLTDMLPDPEIAELLGSEGSVPSLAQALVDAALERGGRDNVTVIVCRIR